MAFFGRSVAGTLILWPLSSPCKDAENAPSREPMTAFLPPLARHQNLEFLKAGEQPSNDQPANEREAAAAVERARDVLLAALSSFE